MLEEELAPMQNMEEAGTRPKWLRPLLTVTREPDKDIREARAQQSQGHGCRRREGGFPRVRTTPGSGALTPHPKRGDGVTGDTQVN